MPETFQLTTAKMIIRCALMPSSLCRQTSCLLNSKRTSFKHRKLGKVNDKHDDDPEYFATNEANPLADIEERIADSKKRLKWRQPMVQQSRIAEATRFLAPNRMHSAIEYMRRAFVQRTLDETMEIFRTRHLALDQRFIADRHRILGNDLAAAHFIVARGGQVKYERSHSFHSFVVLNSNLSS